MSAHPLLLCLSNNPELLELRARVLSTRYTVVPIGSLDAMKALPASSAFDVLVLCHTLSKAEFDDAIDIAQTKWHSIQVLTVSTPRSPSSGRVAARVDSLAGPAALFQSIATVLADHDPLTCRAPERASR